jgi:hypothetical protein
MHYDDNDDLQPEPVKPPPPGDYEGWALVEIFGHQQFSGYVTTKTYGAAVMFEVQVPELPEKTIGPFQTREYNSRWCGYLEPGDTLIFEKVPGFTKIFGVGAIYCLTPCTEANARAAHDARTSRPVKRIEAAKQLPPAPEPDATPAKVATTRRRRQPAAAD